MKIHNSKQYQRIFNEKADDFLSKVDSEFLNKYNIYYQKGVIKKWHI